MKTYKIQFKKVDIVKQGKFWTMIQNIELDDMEFISLADAKTIALVYCNHNKHFPKSFEDYRIVSSEGEYFTI